VTGRFGSSQVFADGTKYKGIDEKGKPKKGNLKTMLGVDSKGDVFPIGTWSGSSWDDISESLKERKVNFGEESILISDGEKGLAESISEIVNDQQRCHWHLHRDLYHMMWQDGGKVEDSRPFQRRLAGILGIELPGEDFKKVPEKEKDEIKQKVSDAEKAILRLINDLMSKGYEEAADYISNAQKYMFSYVKRWLKLGIICPRASSLIERITRELARRLKKIAYNWSDRGAEKIARIILKKFTDKKSWDQYWKDKMRLKNDVIFLINDCKISSQDLAH
jgi:transposase-like protein